MGLDLSSHDPEKDHICVRSRDEQAINCYIDLNENGKTRRTGFKKAKPLRVV